MGLFSFLTGKSDAAQESPANTGSLATEPVPVEVTDAAGQPVTVSARCVVSAAPARVVGLPGADGRGLSVRSWTGPWPADDQWWDAAAGRRLARFQVAMDDGRAWLLLVEAGSWRVEAGYD